MSLKNVVMPPPPGTKLAEVANIRDDISLMNSWADKDIEAAQKGDEGGYKEVASAIMKMGTC